MPPQLQAGRRWCVPLAAAASLAALLALLPPAALRRHGAWPHWRTPQPPQPCAGLSAPQAGDCGALLALAASTRSERWSVSDGWLSAAPHCGWHGITCNAAGRVTALRLDMNQLGGPLPAALGNLTRLLTLSIRHSGLTGSLPPALGRLTALRRLSLSGNLLVGALPAELGALSRLRVLALSGNDVDAALPADFAALKRLHTLSVRLTSVSGVPQQLCAWLEALPLCDLRGTPATLPAGCAAAAAACGVGAPPPAVTRRTLEGPNGFALRLAGTHGAFPDGTGRVYFGDAVDVALPHTATLVGSLAAAVAAGGFTPSVTAGASATYVPPEAAFAVLNSKARFAEMMAAQAGGGGFGSYAARAVSEPPGRGDYPCVLKLAVSDGGVGVHVLRGPRDYAAAAAATAGQERVVQAWARGRVMGTAHYALLRGRPLAAVFFEAPRKSGLRIHKGGITRYVPHAQSPHAPVFEQLFASLNFTGLACVNYIVDAPRRWRWGGESGAVGQLTILEVNPRVGTSLRGAPDHFRRLMLTALDVLEAEAMQARAARPLPRNSRGEDDGV